MRLIRTVLLSCALSAGSLSALAEAVDVNQADAATLAASIKGIGLKKAEAIVAFRDQNGPFKSVEELAKVKGIGKLTVEKNQENLRVGLPSSAK